jgi:hypothetical protein
MTGDALEMATVKRALTGVDVVTQSQRSFFSNTLPTRVREKKAPPQNGPGLFFPALPRLIALVGNEWAPGSLGKQPAAHFPSPCSAGYPGRSREWLRLPRG